MNRRHLIPVAIVVSVTVIGMYANHRSYRKEIEGPDHLKARPAPIRWEVFEPPGAGCVVTMPEDVDTKRQEVERNGVTLPMHEASSNDGPNYYGLFWTDYPPEVVDARGGSEGLQEFLQAGLAAGMVPGLQVRDVRPITHAGLEGFDAETRDPETGSPGVLRVLVHGRRGYFLKADSLPKLPFDRKKAQRFLDSFRLAPGAPFTAPE